MSEARHYTVGGTVHVDALYVFRRADADLLALCRAGEYAFILSSRQVGKSSLMLRTAEQLAQEGVHCVKLTLEEVGKVTTTPEQFYYGILHEIQKELQFETKAHVWWQAHANLSLAQRFAKFFGEVILREVSAPIVVFIDEIDTTLNLPYSDDFFAAIRALYNARANRPEFKRLSFVLIGVATPNDLIKDYTRTPFNVGKRVEVTDFTFEEALPLAQGFDLPNHHARQVLQWILKWTKGHPYLTQRFCRAVAEDGRAKWSEIEIAALSESLFLGRKSREDSNLDFVQKRMTHEGPMRLQLMQTYKDVRLGWRPVADEEQSPVKAELKLTGIVQRENGHLAVRNPIYKEVFNKKWIDEHWPKLLTPTVVKRLKIGLGVAIGAVIVLLAITLWQTAAREVLAKENARNALLLAEQKTLAAMQDSLAAEQARRGEFVADSLRQVAVDINDELKEQRQVAVAAAQQAKRDERLARLAEANAAVQRRKADSLAQINLTRFLSTRAPLLHQEQADTLGLLLARQAYLLNRKLKADLHNEVYHALRKALNGFSKEELGGPRRLEGPRDWAMSVAFSADRRTVAASSADSSIWVWELNEKEGRGKSLRDHKGGVSALAFHPANKILASGGEDRTVRLWDLNNRESKSVAAGKHEGRIWSLAFNANGEALASGGADRKIRLWQVRQTEAHLLAVLEGHRAMVRSLAFSADGRYLASGGADSTIRIWDLSARDYRMLKTWPQPAKVKCLAFSPGGDTLAAGGSEGVVRLWDLQQVLRATDPSRIEQMADERRGHEDEINTLAFNPNGGTLASGSADNTVRLWRVHEPQASPIVLAEHKAWVWSVVFSRAGEQLLSAASDRAVLVWQAEPEALADLICKKVKRNLTAEEWNEYLGAELPYQRTCESLPLRASNAALSNKP